MAKRTQSTGPTVERVLCVGVVAGRRPKGLWSLNDSLEELAELSRSSGGRVVGKVSQRLKAPTQTYLGKGKIDEIKVMQDAKKFDVLVCDDELAPSQQRNLEAALYDVKVMDRTALILDVFARRAQTREGRLQVELAQHEYLLPRLAGQWTHLERQRGGVRSGIGTVGPGETQIETDRRLIRNRVLKIKKELESVRRQRGQHRTRRDQQGVPVVGLVGYTNAGKSTLLNAMTKAGVAAEDRLFSTLDPITRQLRLPSGREMLLTDTVGFIQKLPPLVVNAFRATLEEIESATVLLHVVDISHPNAGAQTQTVEDILDEMQLRDRPRILVLNKVDLLESEAMQNDVVVNIGSHPRTVMTSALTGQGLDRLTAELEAAAKGEPSPTAEAVAG